METLVETQGLPAKKKALAKVRRQLAGLSAVVDCWWQGVWQELQQVALTPLWQRWCGRVAITAGVLAGASVAHRLPKAKTSFLPDA